MAGTIDMDRGRASEAVLDERSEMELLEEELQHYRSVFESASMIVGHELIKPLTSISGYVELLEDKFGETADDDEKRYFLRLRESIVQLQEIVESFVQLLRFDRVGEQAGEFEIVDVRGLVEKLRPREGAERTRLRNSIDPGMPPVLLRRKHLEVVLDNLISNALKHSGGDVPVTVDAKTMRERRGNAAENVLIVTVADEGVGIPEHEIEEIFNPFYRGDSERRAGGLGLGLALVKNIIDIMGGEIRVSSSSGKGTKVTISVPLRDGHSPGDLKEQENDHQ
ncbi:MAG: HAMP domain-containing histidine kinase [Candidatus Krumholzibacteria bacterium]|nr:HAMP domain-containing histidine kinase [Candidatus Krumholzibacteria bacterium]